MCSSALAVLRSWLAACLGADRLTPLASGFHRTLCYKSRCVGQSLVRGTNAKRVWHPIRRQNRHFYKCQPVCFVAFLYDLCHADTDLDLSDAKLARELPLLLWKRLLQSGGSVVDRKERFLPASDVAHSVAAVCVNAETGHSSTLYPVACRRVHALCKRRRHYNFQSVLFPLRHSSAERMQMGHERTPCTKPYLSAQAHSERERSSRSSTAPGIDRSR